MYKLTLLYDWHNIIYRRDSKLVNNLAPCGVEFSPGNEKQLGLVTVKTINT